MNSGRNIRVIGHLEEVLFMFWVEGINLCTLGFKRHLVKFLEVVKDSQWDNMEGHGCVGTALYKTLHFINLILKHSI